MKYLIILLLVSTAYAGDSDITFVRDSQIAFLQKHMKKCVHKKTVAAKQTTTVKQSTSVKQSVVTSSVQEKVTRQTYGSMKVPYKTITIDVYQETDVKVEQRQQQIAALIAQLKQLQESKVTVTPKFKFKVR